MIGDDRPVSPSSAAETAAMARALQAALTIAGDRSSPFSVLTEQDLRRRLADAINDEAQHGTTDADRLKAAALRQVAFALPAAGRH